MLPFSLRLSALAVLLAALVFSLGCDPVRSSGLPLDDDDSGAGDDDDDSNSDDDDSWNDDDDAWYDDDDAWYDDDDYYEEDWDGDGWAWPDDCDDYDASVYPGAPEVCDGRDNDCDGMLDPSEQDNDWDGARPCDGDCDDNNPAVTPWALEVCDGFDNNCDGTLITGEVDGDGDGSFLCNGDCDDADPERYPSAPDPCEDGIDQNCDGVDPICGLCDALTEVEFGGQCFYLDGSGGTCDSGYELARQDVLSAIATLFVGLTYKNQPSDNCCIAHAAQATENQDWGMDTGSCNTTGPFTTPPVLGGSSCIDQQNAYPAQLTFCQSL